MVALLRPQPGSVDFSGSEADSSFGGRQLRLVVDNSPNRSSGFVTERSPRLHAVPDSSRSSELEIRSVVVMALAVAMLVFGALAAIRIVQGSPSIDGSGQIQAGQFQAGQVSTNDAISGSPVVSVSDATAAPGDHIITAQPGDSLWSIAQTIAPERDPRPVVNALIEANNGETVQIGQQIVIPGQLLD